MAEPQEIPLFPLRSVLFPRGKLSLQIFERRYIDLVSQSLRDGAGFGVILLKEGDEVMKPGGNQELHSVGTYARIIDWDQLDNGLLGITVEGESKFQLLNCWRTETGLTRGKVVFSEIDTPDKKAAVSDEMSGMTELLQLLERHPAVQEMELQIDYDNLWDLGWRLSELIPVAMEIKQELLELDDPWERIQLLEQSIRFLIDD